MAAAAAAAPPAGGSELRILVRSWREAACQWEAPAGGTREVACQSDVAQSRDVGVQADLLTRRLCWRRAGDLTAVELRDKMLHALPPLVSTRYS